MLEKIFLAGGQKRPQNPPPTSQKGWIGHKSVASSQQYFKDLSQQPAHPDAAQPHSRGKFIERQDLYSRAYHLSPRTLSQMVHPGQQQATLATQNQIDENVLSNALLRPQRSQNIQINNATNFASVTSDLLPSTSMEPNLMGSLTSNTTTVPPNSWVQSPQDSNSLGYEDRFLNDDSFYPSLGTDLNTGGLSTDDILEYLPADYPPDDTKRLSEPSDSQGLLWELETEEDRLTERGSETDKLWQQQPMDFDVNSVYKLDPIKTELQGEPTLAELNSHEDNSALDNFDVNSFLIDAMDKRDGFNQSELLATVSDVKAEPLLGNSVSFGSWNGSSFGAPIQSAATNIQSIGSPPAPPAATSPTFLNPMSPTAYSNLSSSVPSTSAELIPKQHSGGGKVTSRSFLHPGSPSNSPARRSPLSAGGKPKGSLLADRLSTSAPPTNTMEQMFKARKAEVLRNGRLRHGSTDTTLSQLSSLLTMEDGFSSQADDEDDSDIDERSSGDESGSDNENEGGMRSSLTTGEESASGSKKKGKYFWQYNVQAKGPKGPRMKVTSVSEDPHVLADVTDPVFSPDCQLEGVKHAGKARRGDGNDLTPNANKLHSIGVELKKLNRVINDLTPSTDIPFNARNKSRKEKNKLASRACRLKKKAQHEANKLKLYGLQIEHKRLLDAAVKLRHLCIEKATNQSIPEDHAARVEGLVADVDTLRVAGNSSDYVNKILANISNGVPRGGLDL